MIDYLPLSLLDTDVNDTMGLLTSHYIDYLKDYALLTSCADDCYEEGESALFTRSEKIIEFADKITNPQVRQALIAHNLRTIYTTSQPFPEALVNAFEDRLKQPYLEFVNQFKKSSIAGNDAPHFYLSNPEGKHITIDDLKGQVVLLNFWFVGCKPCEMELPHEKQLVKELSAADFQLVNICTNTPEDVWKEYIRKKDMPGLNLYAKGNWGKKLAGSYQFSSYPTYVLIGQDGKVIMDKAPRPSGESLMKLIKKAL